MDTAKDMSDFTSSVEADSISKPGEIQLINRYRATKADASDIVSLAAEISKADAFIHANACNKLQIIAQQVRVLQEQARKVLQEAKDNNELHRVPCNFIKRPGNVYYLYKQKLGKRCFSIISPQEWGNSCPCEFIGAYHLEQDFSWTPVDRLEEKENELTVINKILSYSCELPLT